MVEFWYQLPVSADMDTVFRCALKAERIGFDGVSCEDHLWVPRVGSGCRPECWTMLTAVAVRTGVKVMPLVACPIHRNPVITAKTVTTLDHLSKGRVIFTYGACWWREELEAFGFGWEPDGVRVDRAMEYVTLLKMLWTEKDVTFEGRFYRVKDATLHPRPFQKPHPPIMCGGSGRRMRVFAARHGDGWIGPVNIFRDLDLYIRRKRLVEKCSGGRRLVYGVATRFRMAEVDPRELRDSIEAFIDEAGVDMVNIRIDPDTENLRLLDRVKPVIEYFKTK